LDFATAPVAAAPPISPPMTCGLAAAADRLADQSTRRRAAGDRAQVPCTRRAAMMLSVLALTS
jgi:hypothetical protein